MHLRSFGSTRLKVSPLGLGLAALGRPGYINLGHADDMAGQYAVEAMQERAHTMLDAAWEAGIRYFDAARSYGRAEEFLGTWLTTRSINPARVIIGSKWGYTYTANWQVEADTHEVKEHSLAVLQRQWQESTGHLGHYLRLYQIHSATLESGVLTNQEVLTELSRLKQQGVVIGMTVSGPRQGEVLRRALDMRLDGLRLFDSFQVTWNLLEQSTTALLHEAHAAGMGVIVKEALANGRLTPRNTRPADAEVRTRLEAQARRLHTTSDALALAAVLAQPWASVVLSGAATPAHLQTNLASLRTAWDAEARHALAPLGETAAHYWATRSALAWN